MKIHEIDGCALMGLNRQDMSFLEIASLGDRRRLLSQIDVVKKESLREVASEPSSAEAPLPQAEVLEIVLRHNTGLNEELEKLRLASQHLIVEETGDLLDMWGNCRRSGLHGVDCVL